MHCNLFETLCYVEVFLILFILNLMLLPPPKVLISICLFNSCYALRAASNEVPLLNLCLLVLWRGQVKKMKSPLFPSASWERKFILASKKVRESPTLNDAYGALNLPGHQLLLTAVVQDPVVVKSELSFVINLITTLATSPSARHDTGLMCILS